MRQQVERLERDRVSRRARLAGRRGRPGHPASLAMTHLTRLDFAIGSAGLMRRRCPQAHPPHERTRAAFQRSLIDQPLMQNVIADLALEVEAATLLAFRLARAVDDEQAGDASAALLARIGTPVGEVLELQARRRRRARGARMPRRQRLHRGRPDGAALSRGAAQRHLGGQRQHHLPRRAARRRASRRRACRPSSTRCGRPRAATGASTGRSTASRPSSASRTSTRRGRAASSRGWRSRCRRAC